MRERVRAVLPGAQETIKWGAPAFVLNGKILLIAAAFQKHAAVNFWRGSELFAGAAAADGMGQLGKLTSLGDLPADAELDRLIQAAAKLPDKAPGQPVSPAKAPPQPHPSFAEALEQAPRAKAAFEGFSDSCRREYCQWIADAKRDDTRSKRIATAIEWLAESKKRNWKYENC